MSNYQPKFIDVSITFPSIANRYRNKGVGYVSSNTNNVNNDVMTSSSELFNNWKNDANRQAFDRVQSTLSSLKKIHRKPYARIHGTNRGPQPFQVSVDQTNQPFNNSVVGSGNITYGSRMSDQDRNIRRRAILQRLADNYEQFNANDASREAYRQTEREIKNVNDKKTIASDLLDSIVIRVDNSNIDALLFKDVYLYIIALSKVIYILDDQQDFAELVGIFEQLIQNIESLNDDLETDNESKYYSALIQLLKSIVEYIKANLNGLGANLNTRKSLALSSMKIIKKSNVIKLLKKIPSVGEDTIEIIKEAVKKEAVKKEEEEEEEEEVKDEEKEIKDEVFDRVGRDFFDDDDDYGVDDELAVDDADFIDDDIEEEKRRLEEEKLRLEEAKKKARKEASKEAKKKARKEAKKEEKRLEQERKHKLIEQERKNKEAEQERINKLIEQSRLYLSKQDINNTSDLNSVNNKAQLETILKQLKKIYGEDQYVDRKLTKQDLKKEILTYVENKK